MSIPADGAQKCEVVADDSRKDAHFSSWHGPSSYITKSGTLAAALEIKVTVTVPPVTFSATAQLRANPPFAKGRTIY
jgi:hypothetical protein